MTQSRLAPTGGTPSLLRSMNDRAVLEVIHASAWGKIKTAAQIAMVLVLILVEGSPLWVDALVYATVLITVASAADYFFGFRKLFHARPSSHSRVET